MLHSVSPISLSATYLNLFCPEPLSLLGDRLFDRFWVIFISILIEVGYSRFPLPSAIYQNSSTIGRTLFRWAKLKRKRCQKERLSKPAVIRLSDSPPPNYKTPKHR